ncbi:hypothetical protein LINPERHAP2_LOCUS9418 [Linum perenne]
MYSSYQSPTQQHQRSHQTHDTTISHSTSSNMNSTHIYPSTTQLTNHSYRHRPSTIQPKLCSTDSTHHTVKTRLDLLHSR